MRRVALWGAAPSRFGSLALTCAERARTPEPECDISKVANPVTFLLWSDILQTHLSDFLILNYTAT